MWIQFLPSAMFTWPRVLQSPVRPSVCLSVRLSVCTYESYVAGLLVSTELHCGTFLTLWGEPHNVRGLNMYKTTLWDSGIIFPEVPHNACVCAPQTPRTSVRAWFHQTLATPVGPLVHYWSADFSSQSESFKLWDGSPQRNRFWTMCDYQPMRVLVH